MSTEREKMLRGELYLASDPELTHPENFRLSQRLAAFWERAAPEHAV